MSHQSSVIRTPPPTNGSAVDSPSRGEWFSLIAPRSILLEQAQQVRG